MYGLDFRHLPSADCKATDISCVVDQSRMMATYEYYYTLNRALLRTMLNLLQKLFSTQFLFTGRYVQCHINSAWLNSYMRINSASLHRLLGSRPKSESGHIVSRQPLRVTQTTRYKPYPFTSLLIKTPYHLSSP